MNENQKDLPKRNMTPNTNKVRPSMLSKYDQQESTFTKKELNKPGLNENSETGSQSLYTQKISALKKIEKQESNLLDHPGSQANSIQGRDTTQLADLQRSKLNKSKHLSTFES